MGGSRKEGEGVGRSDNFLSVGKGGKWWEGVE